MLVNPKPSKLAKKKKSHSEKFGKYDILQVTILQQRQVHKTLHGYLNPPLAMCVWAVLCHTVQNICHPVLKPAKARLVGVLTEGKGCACGAVMRNTWGGHRHKLAGSTVHGLSN